MLDERLRLLLDTGGEAVFTYFQPDGQKSGGAYVTAAGRLRKIDQLGQSLVLSDGTSIPIEDILDITLSAGE